VAARKVNIQDVARYAGVSVSSVSRALNNYPHVSDVLKQRVEAAARELGYQPDFLAHSLRRGTTHSIGFLVGTIANPVVSTIYEGAAQVLAANGYAMTLVSSQNQSHLDNAYLRFLAGRQVNGVIVSSAADRTDEVSALITELGIPTVMLDRPPPAGDHVHAVQSDHITGMRAAVQYLAENGHREIGFIGGLEHFYPTQQRLIGYKLGLEAAGIAFDPKLVHFASFTETDAYAEALVLLSRPQLPTALIAAGNIILIGILMALQERGIEVGRDLALVGTDDIPLTRLHKPAITVVARDLNLLGKTAARLLIQGMKGEAERVIMLPTQLMVRESSNGQVQPGE
jgi:LacI family transcriptional regulator